MKIVRVLQFKHGETQGAGRLDLFSIGGAGGYSQDWMVTW